VSSDAGEANAAFGDQAPGEAFGGAEQLGRFCHGKETV
jgi:hypothetical protein